MALITGDEDLGSTSSLTTYQGGNGDYYIAVWWKDNDGYNQNRVVRIPTSGGKATTEIKNAAANLYRAMEEAGKNEPPI